VRLYCHLTHSPAGLQQNALRDWPCGLAVLSHPLPAEGRHKAAQTCGSKQLLQSICTCAWLGQPSFASSLHRCRQGRACYVLMTSVLLFAVFFLMQRTNVAARVVPALTTAAVATLWHGGSTTWLLPAAVSHWREVPAESAAAFCLDATLLDPACQVPELIAGCCFDIACACTHSQMTPLLCPVWRCCALVQGD
jgi:hypothetical protein